MATEVSVHGVTKTNNVNGEFEQRASTQTYFKMLHITFKGHNISFILLLDIN